jgi:hypothetical protein
MPNFDIELLTGSLSECGYKCKKCQEKFIFQGKREYFYCKLCGTKNTTNRFYDWTDIIAVSSD